VNRRMAVTIALLAVVIGMVIGWRPGSTGEADPAISKESGRVHSGEPEKTANSKRSGGSETAAASVSGRRTETVVRAIDQLPVEMQPPGSRVIDTAVEVKDGRREKVVKLESSLTPAELQIFYTDHLVKDWIIYRDTLTEGVGWSGVFLQVGETERRLGIFTVIREWSNDSDDRYLTKISLLMAEEL
jgi:hypothetical protein